VLICWRVPDITAFRSAKKPLIISDIKGLDDATDNSIRNYDITPAESFPSGINLC